MITSALHIINLLNYIVLATVYFARNVHSPLIYFMLSMCAYYLILIYPTMNDIYIYNLKERTIPKWTYIWRAAFHYLLYMPQISNAFAAVVCIFVIMLWKDILFLIRHAERRLAKIESLLYEEGTFKHRIAHLHHNLYEEDTGNRFHRHCFDTNKLYLFELTSSSKKTALSVHNYRVVRSENNQPRAFTEDEDSRCYEASGNTHIFISQRTSFIAIAPVALIWLLWMAEREISNRLIINHGIIILDIISSAWDTHINDAVVDISYVVGCVACIIFL